MEIKKVIICGLGALGLTYASRLKDICELKILADNNRIEKYKTYPPCLNGKTVNLDYITPNSSFDADLILISTKSAGLESAIEFIKNFVSKKTIIISLINGISSEEKISSAYPEATVIRSFFIGHSAMRNGANVIQDGVGKIVFEPNSILEKFFNENKIDYETSKDIQYSMWIKLGVNIILNELTAIYKCTVGELREKNDFLPISKKLLDEVYKIAQACKIKNLENFEQEVINAASLIANNGKTSMYQDIIAKRKTEVEIFSGEIIRLGKIFGIETPYNQDIYNKIKDIERTFS